MKIKIYDNYKEVFSGEYSGEFEKEISFFAPDGVIRIDELASDETEKDMPSMLELLGFLLHNNISSPDFVPQDYSRPPERFFNIFYTAAVLMKNDLLTNFSKELQTRILYAVQKVTYYHAAKSYIEKQIGRFITAASFQTSAVLENGAPEAKKEASRVIIQNIPDPNIPAEEIPDKLMLRNLVGGLLDISDDDEYKNKIMEFYNKL